jgi:hypothetical protein
MPPRGTSSSAPVVTTCSRRASTMNVVDLLLIRVDDHPIEPPQIVDHHLDAGSASERLAARWGRGR